MGSDNAKPLGATNPSDFVISSNMLSYMLIYNEY